MTFRIDNDVEFFATVAGGTGGTGNLIIGDAVSVNRRTPAGVMNPGDTMIIKIEEAGQHETTLCTLLSSTEMARTRVIDRWDRTGALVTPIESLNLAKVAFSSGQLICGNTIPQPMNIVLQPDGSFAYGDAVRATVFFNLIADIQDPLSDISDGQVVLAVSGLVAGDQLGGLFLYDADGDNGTIDNLDIFSPGTLGAPRPGILIRQQLDISAFFFRDDLSVYAPLTGSTIKQHTLAQGVAGAGDAWMGSRVARGANADGDYTDHELVARDRQVAVVPFARSRSYGNAFDRFDVLKPLGIPSVAAKADVKPGTLARVNADERLYYHDADRGIAELLLSDGGPRATVGTIAALRALTPDGYQDGEIVLVEGQTARGDGEPFLVSWLSGSSSADNGFDVFKPTLHDDGAPWVENGRFVAVAPVRAIKFADSDATPSVAGSNVFTAPDVAPVGGITAFDDFRNNKRIKLQPGAVDVQIIQANGALELPGRTNFTLASVANGGSPVVFEKENGVVSMISGGGAGGQSVADLTALAALGGFGASRDRERVYVKSLGTSYEYRDNLADATDDLIVVPAAGGGTKKWGLPTYLKAQGIDLGDIGVDNTGATDIYPVLLKAVNAAKVRGGLVKFPGSGKFRLATATSIDLAGVKLVGVGKVDRNTVDADASLIEIRQSSVAPFTAGDGTVLEGLSFDYPDQTDSATPTTYAPLIDGTNWRHGGAYLCHVMRAWDFAHLGGSLVNEVCGALEFTGNRIFAINKTLRVRAAPEVIDLDNNHFSVNAIEGQLFPLLDAYSRTNGIGVEVYGSSSAAWGFVDGFNMTKPNFIFGKKIAIQVSDGFLNISQVGGLIDACERWFQVLPDGRVANTTFDGFGWADNSQNSLLTAIELGSTVDAENSLDVQNVNILNAGGTCIAVINNPAGANHVTNLRVRNSSFRNYGGDNLTTDRHGVFCSNDKATILVSGCHFKGRSDETAHSGIQSNGGEIRVSGCSIENLTRPLLASGATARIFYTPDLDIFDTKVNANNSTGASFIELSGGAIIGAGSAEYSTIAALKAASPMPNTVARVQGYAAIGDGGHNEFLVLSGNAAANGYANTLDGVVFQNTAGDRTFVATDPINRLLFERIGIFPGATAAANGAAWALAIAFVDAVNQGANFVVGEGTYGFDRALSVTDIVGVRFVGQGKDRSILNFTGATNTNGIEFIGASWFGGVFSLQVTGADYSGIVIDAGGANPDANNFHMAVRDCELTLNGRHGFQCDEGFMLDLVNVLSQGNGWDGFYIEGFTTTFTAHTCWALSNGRNGGAAAEINGLSGHYGNGWTLNDLQYSTLIGCGSDDNGNDVSGTGFGYFISNCATISLINCGAETSRNSGIAMWANSTIAAGASFSLFSVRNIKIAGFQGVNNNTAEATRVSYNAGAGAGQFPFGTTGAGLIEARSTGTTAHFVKAIVEQCELITPGASPAIIVDGAETDISYIGPTPTGGFSIVNNGKLHQYDAYDNLHQWRVLNQPLFTVGRVGSINTALFEADGVYQEIRGDVYSGGAAFHGTYDTRRRSRGTKSAPAAVQSGDTIAAQDIFGHDGTSFVRAGQIGFSVQGAVSTGVVPGSYAISLADAAGVLTQRISVSPAGVGIFNGTWRVASYTVAGVPAAGTAGAGAIAYISNESGGAVLAFSDGASWRRVTDRAIIS